MRESKIAVFMVKLIYLQRNIPRSVVMGLVAGTTKVRFLFSELMMAAISFSTLLPLLGTSDCDVRPDTNDFYNFVTPGFPPLSLFKHLFMESGISN